MKRITIFLLCFVLLSSCKLLLDNLTMEPEQYDFSFNNDSNVDLFVLMDFNPSPTAISNINLQNNVWRHKQRFFPADYYLSLKKSPDDSVFIYVAFMDSLLMYYDGQHKYHLDPDEIKANALIARLSYLNKDFFDKDKKERDMTIIHFPPSEDSLMHTYYYNGYSEEDFN